MAGADRSFYLPNLKISRRRRNGRSELENYFDAAGTILVALTGEGHIHYVSGYGLDVLGFTDLRDTIGLKWVDRFVPAESRDEISALINHLSITQQPVARLSSLTRPDGGVREISWRYTSFGGYETSPVAVIVSGEDVTGRLAAENALIRSEDLLRAVLQQIPAVVAIIGAPDGELLLRSQRSHQILGHPPLIEQGVGDLVKYGGIHADGRPYAAAEYPIARALQREEHVDGELVRYLRPDGTLVYLDTYATPIHDGAGQLVGAAGIGFDVTARIKAETALRQLIDEREMLIREADHRIKNSLQLVVGILRMQLRHVDDQDPRDVLSDTISRIEAIGSAHLALHSSKDLRTIDFCDILRDLCQQLQSLSLKTSIQCKTDGDCELDADQAIPLALIVSELVTNSLKHAYPGEGGGEIEVALSREGTQLTLTVRDFGKGISDQTPAVGLGSRLTKMLSQQVGATVVTESSEASGTLVTLRLSVKADSR